MGPKEVFREILKVILTLNAGFLVTYWRRGKIHRKISLAAVILINA